MPDDTRQPTLASLQDLLDRVRQDADLPATRRRDLVSALNTLGRWFHLPLSALPASPRGLRRHFERFHPAQAGVSAKRLLNVRAELNAALKRYGGTARGRSGVLSPACQALYEALPDKYRRCCLRPFLRYLSEQGIDPAAVTDEVSAAYLEHLDRNGFKDPRTTHKNLCRAWNQMQEVLPVWPPVRLTVPCYREIWAFRWASFPPAFETAVDAFLSSTGTDDIFAEGADYPLKPRTIATQKDHFRCLASALVHTGYPIKAITSPAVLVEPEAYKAALRWMVERRGGTPNLYILQIAYSVRKYAKYGGCLSTGKQKAVITAYRQLARHVRKGPSKAAQERMKQFDELAACRRLLAYPTRTIKAVLRSENGSVAEALQVQGAIIIGLWLFAPMRLSNFAGLRLDQHLSWPNGDRPGPLLISVPDDLVKNDEMLEFEIPTLVARQVRLYIDRFRPRLVRGVNVYLFPGENGPKHIGSLRDQLGRIAWRDLGLKINPHLMRRIVAKLFLDRHPEQREIIKHLLAHRSERSTAIYTGAERKAALRVYDREILKLLYDALSTEEESEQ